MSVYFMASTTKKGSRKTKAKPRRSVVKKSQPKKVENIHSLRRERDELLAREAATSEILRMIARAPADLQSVMDTIAESAARLCDAKDALIFRVEGDVQQRVAVFGAMPTTAIGMRGITRGTPVGRAIIDRQTIHIHDIAEEIETEFPEYRTVQKATGIRTALATPLMRDGVPFGVINIRRTEVRPFTDKQIKLLETFADQAVIAIENARLIHEQQARNRDLTEALEQQTATSEILGVIASSPTDIQPVLDAVAENAARLCDAKDALIYRVDGDILQVVASYGPIPARGGGCPITRGVPSRPSRGRPANDSHPRPGSDVKPSSRNLSLPTVIGIRTVLATPLLREGVAIGAF